MREFKNIPSKLYEKTQNWVEKEKNLTKTKYGNFNNQNKPKRIMSASVNSHRNLHNNYDLNSNFFKIQFLIKKINV